MGFLSRRLAGGEAWATSSWQGFAIFMQGQRRPAPLASPSSAHEWPRWRISVAISINAEGAVGAWSRIGELECHASLASRPPLKFLALASHHSLHLRLLTLTPCHHRRFLRCFHVYLSFLPRGPRTLFEASLRQSLVNQIHISSLPHLYTDELAFTPSE